MQVTNQQEYSHVAIRNVLKKYQYLDKKDRAFIQKVAKGTIERKILLDYMISQFSSVNIKKNKACYQKYIAYERLPDDVSGLYP